MMFGLIQEQTTQHQQGQPDAKSLLPFWIGCVPHAACWAVLFCHFFVGVQHGHAPAFVWAIIFAMFVLDASFAVNQYLQQRELGRWADYLFGEWVFALLSASAKLLLALLTFFGTKGLQPK